MPPPVPAGWPVFCSRLAPDQTNKILIDGGEDTRIFKAALLDGQLRLLRSLLSRASVAGARLSRDPTGAEKIRKTGHAKTRDDVAVAVVLAVAEGRRRAARAQARPAFQYAIV